MLCLPSSTSQLLTLRSQLRFQSLLLSIQIFEMTSKDECSFYTNPLMLKCENHLGFDFVTVYRYQHFKFWIFVFPHIHCCFSVFVNVASSLYCSQHMVKVSVIFLVRLCLALLRPHGWTVALQALLSVEFSSQEYWSGLLLPSPHISKHIHKYTDTHAYVCLTFKYLKFKKFQFLNLL